MKNKSWHIAGAIFTAAAGTVLHFVYDWFGSDIAVMFGAVNESTWEHMKLLFFPMLVFGIAEYFAYGKKQKGFLPIRTASVCLSLLLIPVIFYTYTGAFGKSTTLVNLALFYFSVFAGWFFSYRQLKKSRRIFLSLCAELLSYAVLLGLLVCFFSFTKNPPQIPLFRDPVSGTYGLLQQTLLRG